MAFHLRAVRKDDQDIRTKISERWCCAYSRLSQIPSQPDTSDHHCDAQSDAAIDDKVRSRTETVGKNGSWRSRWCILDHRIDQRVVEWKHTRSRNAYYQPADDQQNTHN